MDPKTITYQLGLTNFVMEKNLKEISQEDSLVEPRKSGNCLNWVLGHLTLTRLNALSLIGQKPPFQLEDLKAYSGDEPFRREDALPLDELRRRFLSLEEPLKRGIKAMPAEALAKPAPFSPGDDPRETIGSLLAAIAFHEAYHAGQIGLLRRVVGREGVVKPPKIPARL
jgi:uncharacterized damage-inducible protein DinB